MKLNKGLITILIMLMASTMVGCGSREDKSKKQLTVLAAASLTDVCNQIKSNYEASNEDIELVFSYGGSGALQAQIEEGAPCDIFISAATKQMNALNEKGLVKPESIVELLENKVVLVVPKTSDKAITGFMDIATDKVSMIGLGEPNSVPVGQYSEEILTTLNIIDIAKAKANYGSDVRTVLSWVETKAVDCGIVYATDAYSSKDIEIVANAPEGSCKRVIYPVGIINTTPYEKEAKAFIKYLLSDECMKLFESYGFTSID